MSSQDGGLIRAHASKFALVYRVFESALLLLALAVAAGAYDVDLDTGYWLVGLLAVLVFQFAGEASHLYQSWRVYSLREELLELALVCAGVITVLVIAAFLSKTSGQYSRVVMVLWWMLAFAGLAFERIVIRLMLQAGRARGRNERTFAIVGANELGSRVASRVLRADWLGARLLGFYDDDVPLGARPLPGETIAVEGDLAALFERAKSGGIDYIYIALPLTNQQKIGDVIRVLSDTTASVFFVPDLLLFEVMQARWTELYGIPVVSVFDTPFTGGDGRIKRIEDLLIALVALIVLSPLMLAIALGVRFSSPGPVLFRQRRYGLSGKVIEVWKFRTMSVSEDGDVVPQATRADPRVTRFGAFLRRNSLDELPQFINVLQGSMSVIGPRPHAVVHNEQYRKLVPGYMLRHKVRPGITGWAQVNGWRGETDTLDKMQKRVEYDLHYIRNWSIALDLKIIFLTIIRGFRDPGAY